MDFSPPVRRPMAEPFVPMINVVFLLLIFFLMTAQIAPPEPFEITPPGADRGAAPGGPVTLYLSPEGEMGFGDTRGDAALDAVKEAAAGEVFLVRADAGMEAATLAAALRKISEAGVERVEIVTAPR
ncbi:biopolymer transporter ExbD [Pikeienuella piscinae]|uniref:Biopolymer transporter ExbD n=1 Tax=Pikeienuella piscinae TaxID=2748098 RepID=A0A7L5BUY3_9RHOB|nr:biopolymer transporter ExbD [Pikeienuella piscinae]QIE55625.1 biopolymer transporter ExbD [Pikeienuella piscinae]